MDELGAGFGEELKAELVEAGAPETIRIPRDLLMRAYTAIYRAGYLLAPALIQELEAALDETAHR